jgi:DNA polymerase I
MKPLLIVDFEYNQSNEAHMGLVSVDFCSEDGCHKSIWLKDELGKAQAIAALTAIKDTYTLVSFNVVAEASCVIALGLNPRDFTWIDLMLEYKQIQNSNNHYQYGWFWKENGKDRKMFGEGRWIPSTAAVDSDDYEELDKMFGEEREEFLDSKKKDSLNHEQVSPSLANCLKNILEVEIDVAHKIETRNLILERKEVYSEEEKAEILGYGGDDTIHLIPLQKKLHEIVKRRLLKADSTITDEGIEEIILRRGRSAANTAMYAMRGIPIDRDRWTKLVNNKALVLAQAIREFQAEYCNLWKFDPKDGTYHIVKLLANEWIEGLKAEYGIAWPKTKTGDYSMSTAAGMPMQAYRDIIPSVLEYNHLTELTNGLKSHATPEEAIIRKEKGKAVFTDYLGSDDRVRPYYNAYGTQTGRNAPKAVGFIFAQAGWLRGLINPAPGRVLMEFDYASQEALIAAVLSGDKELIKAYVSGDPYLAFAKSARACPQDATKKSHGEVRNLFKSTVLGLQYGMGALKLSIKLTADTGKVVSVEEAKELIDLHKSVYVRYYEWKKEIWQGYREEGRPLLLPDGWYIDVHHPSKMSVWNFPVQGAGSDMMRRMVDLVLDQNIQIVCPVHDSLIVECWDYEADDVSERVQNCMLEASRLILHTDLMRVGAGDMLKSGEFWETEKNAKSLKKFKKYFLESMTEGSSYLERFLAD